MAWLDLEEGILTEFAERQAYGIGANEVTPGAFAVVNQAYELERHRAWHKANPHKNREYVARYQAKLRAQKQAAQVEQKPPHRFPRSMAEARAWAEAAA